MLILDLAGLSDAELEKAVAGHCEPLGTVGNVTIHKPADQIAYAVALVSMATPDESDRVLAGIGDARFGSTVVVRIEQEKENVPLSLRLLADGGSRAQIYDLPSGATQAPGRPQSEISRQRAPIDILLVEDDPADVRMTREALHAAGIPSHLHVVEDGLSAISFLLRTRQFNDAPKPDVIVLDLNIPKFNGHEVLGEIKSNDQLKDIPVVVLTCSRSTADLQKSYLLNADRFMTKAMGMEAYTEQVRSIAALVRP